MSWSQTLESASRIKPELIAQELVNIETPRDGMEMLNVFKKVVNIDDDEVVVNSTARDILSIPYVHSGSKGVAKQSPTYTDIKHTVPPMKFYTRIQAKALKKAARYKNQDFMAWLRENYLETMRQDMDYSLEYLKRSMLTTGDLSYPYFLDGGWNTVALDLGTMVAGGTATNKWDGSTTTITQVYEFLRTIIKTAKNTDGSYSYFQNKADVKIYCPETVWAYAFALLNGKQTIDVVNASIMNEDEILVGGYVLKAFGAEYKNPQTQVNADAITAKQIRIVDSSLIAKHTLAFLELDNVNAKDGNKHVLIQVIPDTYGEYVDICLQMRPVPLFNPSASITATVLS